MIIEHAAFNVPDALGMANWLVENLGMKIVRSGPGPVWCHFLADSSGTRLIEIYTHASVHMPDYAALDARVVHLAFAVDDVPASRQRLFAAGAKSDVDFTETPEGDQFAIVRDPWGFPVQLVRRRISML